MKINILAFAVPMFLAFMALEYWVSRRKGKKYFQFAESVANLNVGIALNIAATTIYFNKLRHYYLKMVFGQGN